jgi:hypothetical protein
LPANASASCSCSWMDVQSNIAVATRWHVRVLQASTELTTEWFQLHIGKGNVTLGGRGQELLFANALPYHAIQKTINPFIMAATIDNTGKRCHGRLVESVPIKCKQKIRSQRQSEAC